MDAGDRVDGKVTGQEEVLGRLIGTRYGRVVGAQRDGDPGVEEDQDRVPSSARHGAGLRAPPGAIVGVQRMAGSGRGVCGPL